MRLNFSNLPLLASSHVLCAYPTMTLVPGLRIRVNHCSGPPCGGCVDDGTVGESDSECGWRPGRGGVEVRCVSSRNECSPASESLAAVGLVLGGCQGCCFCCFECSFTNKKIAKHVRNVAHSRLPLYSSIYVSQQNKGRETLCATCVSGIMMVLE